MPDHQFNIFRLTTSKRIENKFITTQVMEWQNEGQPGTLFTLIDIGSSWRTAANIGQSIINSLTRSYRNSTSTSCLENFEDSLEAVNHTLAKLIQAGETHFVGRLQGVVGLVVDSDVHLSSTGSTKAYLFRGEKISQINEAIVGENSSTRSFVSITSGTMEIGDTIIIGAGDILSKDNIKLISKQIQNKSINEISIIVAKLIKKNKKSLTNALVLQAEKAENVVPPQTLYLDQSIEKLDKQFKKIWEKALLPGLKFGYYHSSKMARTIAEFGKNKFMPKFKSATSLGLQKTKHLARTSYDKAKPLISQNINRIVKKDIKNENILENITHDVDQTIGLVGQSLYNINDYQHRQRKKSIFSKIIGFVISCGYRIRLGYKLTIRFFKDYKNRRLSILICIVAIILILVGSISKERTTKKTINSIAAQKQALSQAQEKIENSKTASLIGTKNDSAKDLGDAITLIQPYINSGNKQIDELYATSIEGYDKLTNTTRYTNISPIATQSGEYISISDPTGYIFDKNSIKQVTLSTGESNILTIKLNDLKNIFSSGSHIYLITHNNGLEDFTPGNNQISPISIPFDISNSIDFEKFGNNIYFLDTKAKQILKAPIKDSKIENSSNYLTQPASELSSAISMSIDGSILVLTKSGSVFKYTKSGSKQINLSDIPTPKQVSNPFQIYTSTIDSTIWIVDKGDEKTSARLLQFDKDGKYTHQYILPVSSGKVSDVYINDASKRAWLLGDGKLYELDL